MTELVGKHKVDWILTSAVVHVISFLVRISYFAYVTFPTRPTDCEKAFDTHAQAT